MSRPRAFLVVLGIAFLVAAVVIAETLDRLTALGAFIVGAFLLVLPFLAIHEEE